MGVALAETVPRALGGILSLAKVATGPKPDTKERLAPAIMFSELSNETLRVLGLEGIENRLCIMDDTVLETFESHVILGVVQPGGQGVTGPRQQHGEPLQAMLLDLIQQSVIIAPIIKARLAFDPTPAHVRLDSIEPNRANQRQMIPQTRQGIREVIGARVVAAGRRHPLRWHSEFDRRFNQGDRFECRLLVSQHDGTKVVQSFDAEAIG